MNKFETGKALLLRRKGRGCISNIIVAFVTQASKAFRGLKNITTVEKKLSGRVLSAPGSSVPVPVSVQVKGFKNTSNNENGKYDLVVSNIPSGKVNG
jgi:hypothetical protein